MPEYLLKLASIYLLSTFKFVGGPLLGRGMGLSFWPTLSLTVAGMMTSVVLISGVGRRWVRYKQQQRRARQVPVFSPRARRIVRVFQRFGMAGIAFLTPILLTPVGGTVIATLLGVPRGRILLHMLWSALLWGSVLTLASEQLARLLHR